MLTKRPKPNNTVPIPFPPYADKHLKVHVRRPRQPQRAAGCRHHQRRRRRCLLCNATVLRRRPALITAGRRLRRLQHYRPRRSRRRLQHHAQRRRRLLHRHAELLDRQEQLGDRLGRQRLCILCDVGRVIGGSQQRVRPLQHPVGVVLRTALLSERNSHTPAPCAPWLAYGECWCIASLATTPSSRPPAPVRCSALLHCVCGHSCCWALVGVV